MEIRTNRSAESQSARVVPPPDRSRHRKKAAQKLGPGHIAGRRVSSALRTMGKLCAFLLLVLFMLSIFVYAFTSDKFNLRRVRFYGCKELDSKRMEEMIRNDFPASILRIDLPKLKKRLEQEKWARQVEIRRVLPSELIIYVEERIPSVILEMNSELMVADRDGTLLDKYDPRFGKLDVPVLRGVMGEDMEGYRLYQGENTERIRQALAMLSEIESGAPEYAHKISEIDMSDRENMKIMLVDDTVEVYLGGKDYLKRFRTLMDRMGTYQELKSQNNDIASIDLRFENQIWYRLRGASASVQR